MDKYEEGMSPIDKLKRHRSVLKLQTHLHNKLTEMKNNMRKKQSNRWFRNIFSRKNSKKKEKMSAHKKNIQVDGDVNQMRRAQRKRFTQMDLTFKGNRQFSSGLNRLRRANTISKPENGNIRFYLEIITKRLRLKIEKL